MNGESAIEVGQGSQLREDLRYKLGQVSVWRQRDLPASGNESGPVEEIERNRVGGRLKVGKSNADICSAQMRLHVDQAPLNCRRFQNARL